MQIGFEDTIKPFIMFSKLCYMKIVEYYYIYKLHDVYIAEGIHINQLDVDDQLDHANLI